MVFIIDKVIANCLQERIPQDIIYHFSFHQTKKLTKKTTNGQGSQQNKKRKKSKSYPKTSHCCSIVLVQQVTQVKDFALVYAKLFNHIIYSKGIIHTQIRNAELKIEERNLRHKQSITTIQTYLLYSCGMMLQDQN